MTTSGPAFWIILAIGQVIALAWLGGHLAKMVTDSTGHSYLLNAAGVDFQCFFTRRPAVLAR